MSGLDGVVARSVAPSQAKSVIWNPNDRYWCFRCDQSGVTHAMREGWRESGEGPYAFRCSCSIGGSDRRRFPRWSDQKGFELMKR